MVQFFQSNMFFFLSLNVKLSRSFLNIFINKPIGVTTKKNIIPITRGETIFPNNIPNLNQSLLSGDKIAEFNKPKIIGTIKLP